MNDEIKEILDKLKDKDNDIKGINFLKYQDLTRGEINLLLDYITNLQQDNEKIGKLWREEEAHCILLQQENERLKETIKHYEDTTTFGDYVKEVNLLIDYKSRCEKAIEYNYELQERYCHSAIFDELVASKVYEITEKELNILQNGGENNER